MKQYDCKISFIDENGNERSAPGVYTTDKNGSVELSGGPDFHSYSYVSTIVIRGVEQRPVKYTISGESDEV